MFFAENPIIRSQLLKAKNAMSVKASVADTLIRTITGVEISCNLVVQGNRDKGGAGKAVENYLRGHASTKEFRWVGPSSPLPDCEGLEIKSVPVVINSARSSIVVKEDTQVHMVSAQELLLPFEKTFLYEKLNMIVCFYQRVSKGKIKVLLAMHLDLRSNSQIKSDFLRAGMIFDAALRLHKSPSEAVSCLGSSSGAYGSLLKPKTKGPGGVVKEERTRCFYLRSSAMNIYLPKSLSVA